MVSPESAVVALGLLLAMLGSLGWSGRLLRGPSWLPFSNFTAMACLGIGLVLTMLTVAAGTGTPAAAALSVPAMGLLLFGAFCLLARTPRWAQPAWQREVEARLDRRRR